MKTSHAFSPSHNPASQLKKISIWSILFFAGLITGLAFFSPRETFWQYLISKVDQNYEALSISSHHLSEAKWNRAHITNLKISGQDQSYFFPGIRVRMGFRPIFRALIDTGSEIAIKIETRKKLSALGEIDLLTLLPDRGIKGSLWIDGVAFFTTWSQPPYEGILELESRGTLRLGQSPAINHLTLQAVLKDNRLEIQDLRAEEPVRFSCSGHVLLNWNNPAESTYDVQGHFTLAGDNIPFDQRGNISDLFP